MQPPQPQKVEKMTPSERKTAETKALQALVVAALQDRNASEVARRTGIHRNTIARIRAGRGKAPALHVLEVLGEYLGVDK